VFIRASTRNHHRYNVKRGSRSKLGRLAERRFTRSTSRRQYRGLLKHVKDDAELLKALMTKAAHVPRKPLLHLPVVDRRLRALRAREQSLEIMEKLRGTQPAKPGRLRYDRARRAGGQSAHNPNTSVSQARRVLIRISKEKFRDPDTAKANLAASRRRKSRAGVV